MNSQQGRLLNPRRYRASNLRDWFPVSSQLFPRLARRVCRDPFSTLIYFILLFFSPPYLYGIGTPCIDTALLSNLLSFARRYTSAHIAARRDYASI
ncbi:hypothetical protein HZS61_012823 [Fusarium oxysporum f. sp. conglutinans]|uniref:Uncharacterized protein n=1 Tax=Fusarium oxysporum f. sp. conglutinans TaxID=100902 RepID=A0A8H6GT74_FUSOX|nr:hypothetical protein HZS61_012823 [Fusarium oxysporum f. sp. conglutinans]